MPGRSTPLTAPPRLTATAATHPANQPQTPSQQHPPGQAPATSDHRRARISRQPRRRGWRRQQHQRRWSLLPRHCLQLPPRSRCRLVRQRRRVRSQGSVGMQHKAALARLRQTPAQHTLKRCCSTTGMVVVRLVRSAVRCPRLLPPAPPQPPTPRAPTQIATAAACTRHLGPAPKGQHPTHLLRSLAVITALVTPTGAHHQVLRP